MANPNYIELSLNILRINNKLSLKIWVPLIRHTKYEYIRYLEETNLSKFKQEDMKSVVDP